MIETIEKFNRALGRVAAWCALIMMLAQVFSVVARYVFGFGAIAIQESVVYGHSILFLLGAAVVLQLNQHVRVDVFYAIYNQRTRRIVDITGLLLFVLPVAMLIGYTGWPYVARAWSTLEASRQAGGLPAVFLLKSAIIIFAVSVSAQAIATIARILRGENWPSDEANNG